ncbi:hypothetical protein [Amycolatopsis magusensis]|uniref:hypothetical protein n=1 Tax=Amycolatopsis magusensis TaxID=882444 RepID=UPI0037B3F123
MSFPEFSRKQRQHDNDIESLYKLAAETKQRVDVIDTKVSSMLDVQRDHSTQLRRVQTVLEGHEARFTAIDSRLGEILELLRGRGSETR